MPLIWKLDPANSLVVFVTDGEVTRLEIEKCLEAIVDKRVVSFRKVFDASRGAATSMTAEEFLPLAVRMRSLHELGEMGPLAIVLPPHSAEKLGRTLGMLASMRRPMRIFTNDVRAYRWVAKQSLPDPGAAANEGDRPQGHDMTVRGRVGRLRRLAEEARAEAEDAVRKSGNAAAPSNEHSTAGEHQSVLIAESGQMVLYRGQADILHRGLPLNICVRKAERSWEFLCCRADRKSLGTLLTLSFEEIAGLRSRDQDPLAATLEHLKDLAHKGMLAVPDDRTTAY